MAMPCWGVRCNCGAPGMSTRSFLGTTGCFLPLCTTQSLERRFATQTPRPIYQQKEPPAPLPAGAGQRLPPPELLISALSPIINISVQGLARRCPDLPLRRYRRQIKPSQAERGTKHSIFYRALLSPETRSNPAFLSPGCEPSFLLIVRNCCCLIKWRE